MPSVQRAPFASTSQPSTPWMGKDKLSGRVGYEGRAAQADDFGSFPVGGGRYLEV